MILGARSSKSGLYSTPRSNRLISACPNMRVQRLCPWTLSLLYLTIVPMLVPQVEIGGTWFTRWVGLQAKASLFAQKVSNLWRWDEEFSLNNIPGQFHTIEGFFFYHLKKIFIPLWHWCLLTISRGSGLTTKEEAPSSSVRCSICYCN